MRSYSAEEWAQVERKAAELRAKMKPLTIEERWEEYHRLRKEKGLDGGLLPGLGGKSWKQVAKEAWSAPSWKEAARDYHANRPPTKISDAEFRKWRRESGLDESPQWEALLDSGYDAFPVPLAELPQDPPLTSWWSTGWVDLDEYYHVYPGQFTVVSGLAGSGKSTFLFNMLLRMAVEFGHHVTMWVPENQAHICEIMRRLWQWEPSGIDYLLKNQFYAQNSNPDLYQRQPQTLQTVLDRIGTRIDQDEISVVLLDPWNELERAKPKDMLLTDYIGQCLMYAKRFARQHCVAVIMVAHPTKAGADRDHQGLYDIEGSNNWFNKCDSGLIVERNHDTNVATVKCLKVREIGGGKIGQVQFKVDPLTGIFTPFGAGIDGFEQKTSRDKRNSR